MVDPSRAYFPLRSNAESLVAGGGVASVRRRIKRASLLHDEVVFESGVYDLFALTSGEVHIWRPEFHAPRPSWQTARSRAKRGTLKLTRRRRGDGAALAAEQDFDHAVTMHWQPTLEPFREELPKGCDWIVFGHIAEPPELPPETERELSPPGVDAALAAKIADPWLRKLVIRDAHVDLHIGASLGSVVAVDRRHDQVLRERGVGPNAHRSFGDLALSIIVPSEPTWDEVVELRKTRGLADFRTILRDVEAEARESADSVKGLQLDILRGYSKRLAEAEARRPSLRSTVAATALGIVVGQLAAVSLALPSMVTELGGAAAGVAVQHALEVRVRPKWLAIHERVRVPTAPR
jgi:hypothetical protein